MTRPLRIVYPGAFYHITSRGNEKRAIFSDRRDRERFIGYLESATQRYDAAIHAFCLMTNHYHLLLETPSGNLPQIMRHINGAYTTYFNIKQDRAGHLFQGRYKAILVDADGYAKNLSRYIHLNPVRGNLVEKPEEYAWSSYRCYIDKHLSPQWLRRNFILAYFGNSESDAQKRYRTFVEFLLNKKYDNPLKDTIGATLLGRPEFIDFINKNHLTNETPDRDLPSLKKLVPQASLATIFKEVELCFSKDPSLAKKIKMYLARHYTPAALKEIGSHFNIGESGVSQVVRRFKQSLKTDEQLRKQLNGLIKALNLSRV